MVSHTTSNACEKSSLPCKAKKVLDLHICVDCRKPFARKDNMQRHRKSRACKSKKAVAHSQIETSMVPPITIYLTIDYSNRNIEAKHKCGVKPAPEQLE